MNLGKCQNNSCAKKTTISWITDRLIFFMACHLVKGYFMPWGEGIVFIEHSYLNFCIIVSEFFFGHSCFINYESFLNSLIWLIDGTPTGTTTPCERVSESNNNEGIFYTIQIRSLTISTVYYHTFDTPCLVGGVLFVKILKKIRTVKEKLISKKYSHVLYEENNLQSFCLFHQFTLTGPLA